MWFISAVNDVITQYVQRVGALEHPPSVDHPACSTTQCAVCLYMLEKSHSLQSVQVGAMNCMWFGGGPL